MEETVLLPYDTGVFSDALHRVCDGYEYKYTDPMPPERVPILWRIPGRNPLRQHETGGHQTSFKTGRFHVEPAVRGLRWLLRIQTHPVPAL